MTPPRQDLANPSSTTIEEVDDPAPMPGFDPPKTSSRPSSSRKPDPNTSPPPTPSQPSDRNGSAGGDDADDLSSFINSESSASSPTGSAGPSPAFTDPALFVGIVRQLVGLVSLGVRFVRQRRSRVAFPPGLWLADEEDQANIGDPLARIAARHTPLSGEGTSDVADGIEAMIGTAAYAAKHLEYEAYVNAEAQPDITLADQPEGEPQ
jgi:hypothetical protein